LLHRTVFFRPTAELGHEPPDFLDAKRAILVGNSAFYPQRMEQLAALAARHALPAIYSFREYAFDAIVLPAERHATIISGDEPAVRDGDAMGVAREIAQHLLWPGERLNSCLG
jgi:hypothetical protein